MYLMKQLKRSDYFLRHLRNLFPYLTVRKIVNLVLNVVEMKCRVLSPRSLPPYIKIEPTPLCQLRCTGCPQRETSYKKQFGAHSQLTLEQFKQIVDPLSATLLGISLSYRGDPLLNEDLALLIEYASGKNIAVSFPTNLSLKLDTARIERLVQSGLASISVSLDGTSEETYSKYRVGGNFQLVLNNVRALAEAKRKFGVTRPRIIWKFVIFTHNSHEIETVRTTYLALGFDEYELVPDYGSVASKTARATYKANLVKKQQACFWPWHTMVIQSDGEVSPCCVSQQSFALGNVLQENSNEIWRGKPYRELRQGFASEGYGDTMHPICRQCMGYLPANRIDLVDTATSPI